MNFNHILFILSFITSTVPSEASELFPPSWQPLCDFVNDTVSVNITCNLNKGDPFRIKLKDLNEYSGNNVQNLSYSVEFNCNPGAEISMSLPMKIPKLYQLKVQGCKVFDYIDDWNDHSLDYIDDSLVYLEMNDCITMMNIIAALENIQHFENTSNEWLCGHDSTLKQSISRNLSFELTNIPPELMSYLDQSHTSPDSLSQNDDSLDLQRSIGNIMGEFNPKCRFNKLELLEEVKMEATHFQSTAIIFRSVLEYPKLKIFNFSQNGYERFPHEWNENSYKFPELEYVDYSYNLIPELKTWGFEGQITNKDTVLDLRYNNITTLSTYILKQWAAIRNVFIDIRGNPLKCDCVNENFIFAVQKNDFFQGPLQKYKYIQNMTCASPESARGIKISDVTKVSMGCEIPPEDLSIYLIVIGVAAAILIIVVVMVFWFRKEIKILLYTRFGIIFPWDVEEKSELKKYDAFISYSSKDSDWLFDYLVKELETPSDSTTPMELCIHGRDFIGGISILQNIIESIENSRHTVVVLSRHFIKSVWAMAEFKEAYEESITKKRRHLIIIKYEEIPEAEMDSMLKRCLKTFTYLDVNDSMFLARLRFALATRSRSYLKQETEKPKSSSPDIIAVHL